MKKKQLFSAALCLLVSSVASANLAVIVNKGNSSELTADAVKRIYLGKMDTFSDGTPVSPLDIADGAVKDDFNQSIVGRNTSQVSAYWSKMIFTGKGTPPDVKPDENAVIDAVANNPTAIGYISMDALGGRADEVRVITL